MTGVLDELGLTGLVTTITGLTAAGAAAILAETSDRAGSPPPRALVKHAGLCSRDNASGAFQGACAAALLRWIHVVITQRVSWDPAIAAGCTPARSAA